ncbi:MAG: DUF1549 domain-containing protein [Pirellulaceae bacterium]
MSKYRFGQFLLAAVLVTGIVGLSDRVQAQSLPADVAARIDQLLVTESNDSAQTTPVPLVDDETFLRRVFMDLVGEPPTTEDVLAFSLDGTVDKRSRLVRQLLADASYGRNWARYWRDVIMYRRSDERALLSVRSLESYLTDAFNSNTSWDKLTTEFITARGDVRANGRTALIMAQMGRPEETVAEVSRIFLGIQIQCAQCHDHPTDRWTREQFHELVAFFPRVAVRPKRDDGMFNFEVVASDSPIENRSRNTNNRYRGTPEHRMPDLENPEARGETMKPVFFLTGDEVPVGSLDADRRSQLAGWITDSTNPWFARAFVNRIWAELVGEGFYDPVDDLGPGKKCSSPETLDYLAAAFRERGHDIKWLFTTILSTDAYQRASRRRRTFEESPFQANCAQPLRADQLYSSLQTVLEIPESNATPGRQRSSRSSPRNVFNSVFGFDPSTRRGDVTGTIPQALTMMNSPRINQYATAEKGRMLGRLLQEVADDRQAITELYLRVLSRQPTDKEVDSCLKYRRNLRDREEAFEDILWALINTAEFAHRK